MTNEELVEKVALDVTTLLYCCERLEYLASQHGGANATIIGVPLRQIAQNWRDLIDDCEVHPRAALSAPTRDEELRKADDHLIVALSETRLGRIADEIHAARRIINGTRL